jgi:YVTN family beta-propeller protein
MTVGQLGKYRLESLLGVGGMGEVYKAYDTQRDRHVALKLLPESLSGDREYLKRFQGESNLVARLRDPHVIPIHDFGDIGGRLFIDMRLVDGADIGALLDAYGPIEPQRAVHLVGQVAEALDAAHADNLVHRDIKPTNILVTFNDFVYVVDFGIARPIDGRHTPLTNTGVTIGTLHYMAPERFVGRDVDGRADIYSLACVLHECLTGAPPFSGKDLPALMYAQLHSGPPEASSLVEGIPPALDAVIAFGMAKDPKDRFPSAGALAAAAREALLGEAPTPHMAVSHHTWTELPDPTRQEAVVVATRPETPEPTGSEPESEGGGLDRSPPYSPTQTVAAESAENGQQGTTADPDDSPPPPGRPVGGPADDPADDPADEPADDPADEPEGRSAGPLAWRRRGVAILAGAAVLAVAIALVVMASPGTRKGGAAPTQNPGSGTKTRTVAAPSAPSLAVPTVAEKLQVGHNPNYVQVAPNGKFAYITNSATHAITVIDTANDQVSGTIPFPQGPPQSVSFSRDSRTAYVSVYGDHSAAVIVFINTATGAETGSVPVNNIAPGPSAISPDGVYLYVPNHNMVMGGTGDNDVDVINTVTRKLIKTFGVMANPHWVVFGDNGKIYVTNHMSAVVTVLNASNIGDIIGTIPVGETPHSEALSPDGSRLAVTSYNGDEVFLINTATDRQIQTIPVGRRPLDIAYSPDGRYLFTVNNFSNTVTVIDTADDRVIGEIPTGKAPTSISVLPNGRQAYVTDENDGTIEVLDLPE